MLEAFLEGFLVAFLEAFLDVFLRAIFLGASLKLLLEAFREGFLVAFLEAYLEAFFKTILEIFVEGFLEVIRGISGSLPRKDSLGYFYRHA